MSRRFTKNNQTSASKQFLPKQFLPKRLLRSTLTAAALGAGFLAVVAPAAHAGGSVFQQHVVNAGVLVNDVNTQGNGPLSDPAPYLFYVLNNRADVRPPDLTLVNPLAPASVTTAILNRWTPNVATPTAPYKLGQTITPDMAPYWEVSLNSISDNELAQYDVLYLRADSITFRPALNEKLRRFVDNGGELIVEYGFVSAPPIGLFTGAGAVASTPTGLTLPPVPSSAASLSQPLVSQPYFLTAADAVSLFSTISSNPLSLAANTADGLHGSDFTTIFSPALMETISPTSSVPAVSTAQIGGGQVVISALQIGTTVSPVNDSTILPSNVSYYLPQPSPPNTPRPTVASDFYNVPAANPSSSRPIPAADLKLLANAIEGLAAHPNENKTSHGNASSVGLASFSPAWQYPLASPGAAAAPGAAVWGNFVFVTDAVGTLHAFDAYPSERLTGGASADDGSIADYSLGTSYDEIWNVPASGAAGGASIGIGSSAPTVAAFGGANYVFVEKHDGSVVAFNAVTGTAGPAFTPPSPPSGYTATPYATGANAPSPTYYDGRLYAGQANGTLAVYDLNAGTSAAVPLNSPTGGSVVAESVTGPPAVGTLADGDTNVLVAVVPTQYNVYSVLLGARNEPLKQYLVNNVLAGYSINRLGRYDLNNIFADLSTVPALLAHDSAGNVVAGTSANSTAPNPQDPLFSITNSLAYYTDWNMDFPAAVGFGGGTPAPVNLNYISASSYGLVLSTGPVAAQAMSAPAIDRHGDYYYTETNGLNSYLIGVSNAPLHNNVHVKFRFRMPTQADGTGTNAWDYKDADGVNYSSLIGYQFVGTPAVDDQGNVYALATNASLGAATVQATVLCFRANQQVTATFDPANLPSPEPDLTQTTITQPDESATEMNTIQRGPDSGIGALTPTYGQFIGSPTTLAFYNFAKRGRTAQEIAGNLSEPQPITATDTLGTTTMTTLKMRTNLAWFMTPFGINPSVTGLSQVGSSLFLSDGTVLYRVTTKPQVGTGKIVSTPAGPFETPIGIGNAGVGNVGAPPSIGGNVMVLNGTGSIATLTRQVTVIADNNRILGVDGDGAAVWAVEATTRTDPATGYATKVPFSHPTALSQFALNDYLAADTGSNRCVRFDSAGNVQWELTRFQDPNGLMAAGQPLTLSQPSSVITRPPVPDTSTVVNAVGATVPANPGGSYVYYLIADSGNNRVVEVEDRVRADGSIFVDAAGNSINHVLSWVTHTGDKDGRNYRYGSAVYYTGTVTVGGQPVQTLYVAATVVNTRLAPLTPQALPLTGMNLGPVSGDAPGGSIVVFTYPVSATPQPYNPAGLSDLAFTTAGFYAASGTAASPVYTPFTIRNPRFLQLYTPPVTAAAATSVPSSFDFLYADDNGAFDLTFNTSGSGPKGFIAGVDRLQFTAANYQAMNLQAFGVSGTITRAGLPFIATCVQALSTDSQTANGTTTTTRRYLITQNYSQGELSAPASPSGGKIGGEVFEVDVTNPPPGAASGTVPTGGFAGNQTLSHPDLTGPLTQPTYAVRLP